MTESAAVGVTDVETSDDGTAGLTPLDTMHRHANAELSSVVYITRYVCVCVCASVWASCRSVLAGKHNVVSNDDPCQIEHEARE